MTKTLSEKLEEAFYEWPDEINTRLFKRLADIAVWHFTRTLPVETPPAKMTPEQNARLQIVLAWIAKSSIDRPFWVSNADMTNRFVMTGETSASVEGKRNATADESSAFDRAMAKSITAVADLSPQKPNVGEVEFDALKADLDQAAGETSKAEERDLSAEFDANVDRLKACEHIACGDEGWKGLRNLCPSTNAVAALRDKLECQKPVTFDENLVWDKYRELPPKHQSFRSHHAAELVRWALATFKLAPTDRVEPTDEAITDFLKARCWYGWISREIVRAILSHFSAPKDEERERLRDAVIEAANDYHRRQPEGGWLNLVDALKALTAYEQRRGADRV